MKSKKNNYHNISCFALIFIVSTFPLSATEHIIPQSVSVFSLKSSSIDSQQYSLSFDDALILKIEEHIRSLVALDIEIVQNKPLPLSIAVYSLEESGQAENEKKYKVQELETEDMQKKTNTFRLIYEEALGSVQEKTIKTLSSTISEKKSPLLLRFSQASQVAANTNKQNKLTVKIKPVFQDMGGIKFNLIYPTNVMYFPPMQKPDEAETKKNIAVRLDDKHITDLSKPYMTRLGEHKVQVDSHFYKSEVITCIVEKGKIEEIDIELKPLAPLITVEGPCNVQVFFDDVAINLPFVANVEAGEHSLRFKTEGYEAMRRITAEQGKKYFVNLTFEVNIVEK